MIASATFTGRERRGGREGVASFIAGHPSAGGPAWKGRRPDGTDPPDDMHRAERTRRAALPAASCGACLFHEVADQPADVSNGRPMPCPLDARAAAADGPVANEGAPK
ncbi:hypothetical protein GCM10011392_21310 [Wenxinia marina]|nr:hypothetical protein GCM10011392_21310 [Wenxinia marina]